MTLSPAALATALDYASRHLRRQVPGVHRVERLRRKLGGCDTRPFAPLPTRRRGRGKAYHEQPVAMIQAEEAKLVSHLGSIVHDLKRRIRSRQAGQVVGLESSASA